MALIILIAINYLTH